MRILFKGGSMPSTTEGRFRHLKYLFFLLQEKIMGSCLGRYQKAPLLVETTSDKAPQLYNPYAWHPICHDIEPELYVWRYRVIEHEALRVAFYAVNVAPWETDPPDQECFITWDILEQVYSFFQVEPELTFQTSGTSVFEPSPQAEGRYETDLSVEPICHPQEYIAMRFHVTKCVHDVMLVPSSYDTGKQIYRTTKERFSRIGQTGTYVLCVCTEHGQAALAHYESGALELWPAPTLRVEAPRSTICVSIFG